MSEFSSTGITIAIKPRLLSSSGLGTFTLQDTVESYQHTIVAAGGFETASFTFKVKQADAEQWLATGLARHVEVYDPSLVLIWEGFVDEVKANIGPLSVSRGPVSDIANRSLCTYSDSATSVQGRTAVGDNLDSQGYYGIWHKNTSGGSSSAALALKQRDVFLADNAWPGKSQDVSDTSSLSVTLNCRGYDALLDYPYSEGAGASTVRTKIIDVVAEEPNGIFSTDYNLVEVNTLAVPALEDQYRTGVNIIKTLVSLGGLADNTRRIWGVYGGRRIQYSAITTETDYLMYLSEGPQQVRTAGGILVRPWNVLPGKWLQFPDLMPNAVAYANPYTDLRKMFIESVSFSAPMGLSLQGGKVDKLPQLLARRNMLQGL